MKTMVRCSKSEIAALLRALFITGIFLCWLYKETAGKDKGAKLLFAEISCPPD